MSSRKATSFSVAHVANRILTIRGQRVILDSDLAALYGVTTGRFNEAVARNIARFPTDFMFRLSDEEFGILISQIATSRSGHGGRRKLRNGWMSWRRGSKRNSRFMTTRSRSSFRRSVV